MFKLYTPSTRKKNPFPQHLLKTEIQEIKKKINLIYKVCKQQCPYFTNVVFIARS
jgi:hypothetical protein